MFRRKKKSTPKPVETFTYGRNELVNCMKRHYELLVWIGYLEPDEVLSPPEPAGWSDRELNVDALRSLHRNEAVIDLLRHIPYPRPNDTIIDYETMAFSFLRQHWRPERDPDPNWHQLPFCDLGMAPFDGPMPPHLISLTHEEAQVGTIWVIDTDRGCIYPHGQDYYLYGDAPPEAEQGKPWLSARAVSFTTFFDKLYKDIFSLKLVPVPAADNFGPAILGRIGPESKAIRELYRKHGWPDDFHKEAFLPAAVALRKVILDDTYDWTDIE